MDGILSPASGRRACSEIELERGIKKSARSYAPKVCFPASRRGKEGKSVFRKERTQPSAPPRRAQAAQSFAFNLADSFARERQAVADFLERSGVVILQAEAKFQHLLLARRQSFQHGSRLLLQVHMNCGVRRRGRALVFQEIAQLRFAVI